MLANLPRRQIMWFICEIAEEDPQEEEPARISLLECLTASLATPPVTPRDPDEQSHGDCLPTFGTGEGDSAPLVGNADPGDHWLSSQSEEPPLPAPAEPPSTTTSAGSLRFLRPISAANVDPGEETFPLTPAGGIQ